MIKTLDKFSNKEKKNIDTYKYLYCPKDIAYISNAHNIYYKNQKKYLNRNKKNFSIKFFFQKLFIG